MVVWNDLNQKENVRGLRIGSSVRLSRQIMAGREAVTNFGGRKGKKDLKQTFLPLKVLHRQP